MLKKGDRVRVRHGTGTIVGFERFDGDGQPDELAETQADDERVAIALDEDHTWCFNGLYYATPREITLLNEERRHV